MINIDILKTSKSYINYRIYFHCSISLYTVYGCLISCLSWKFMQHIYECRWNRKEGTVACFEWFTFCLDFRRFYTRSLLKVSKIANFACQSICLRQYLRVSSCGVGLKKAQNSILIFHPFRSPVCPACLSPLAGVASPLTSLSPPPGHTCHVFSA